MSFLPYSKYRDSKVDWLGKIPAHWSAKRLKFATAEPIRNGVGEPGGHDSADWPRYVRITDIAGPRQLREDTFASLPPEVASEAPLRVGDLLLAAVGATFGKSYLHVRDIGPACFAGFMVRVSPAKELDSEFAAYWTESASYWALLRSRVVQSTIQNFSAGKYRDLALPLPPVDEQQTIVAFLNHQTAMLDALIAEQLMLIDLINEKRRAVITNAVTKGMNRHVPMKPSGVEWLGDLPAHWEARRLSTVSTRITNGYVGPTWDILVDGGVRYLQSLHIKGNRIRFDVPYFVAEEWSRQHAKSILQVGDVLIVQTGDIGQAAVVTPEYAGCNCHALIIVSPDKNVLEGGWLSWCLNSEYGYHTLLSIQTGALHPHLNCGNVKSVIIPLPPQEEQRLIVRYVAERLAEFDALVAESEQAISLLQERRTALISAAVTGKIDVREFAQTEAA